MNLRVQSEGTGDAGERQGQRVWTEDWCLRHGGRIAEAGPGGQSLLHPNSKAFQNYPGFFVLFYFSFFLLFFVLSGTGV